MQILTAERTYETRSANPYLPWGTSSPPTNGQIGSTSVAGITVTDKNALQLAAVWASVSLISDSIASLPVRQWRLSRSGEPKAIDPSPVIAEPWPELRPGPGNSMGAQRAFITQGTVSNLLRGNIFGRIAALDDNGLPSMVALQPPDRVDVRRNQATGQIEFRYDNKLVPPDLVTRTMAMSLPGGIIGLNPIEYMRNVLGVARAQDLYGGAFYANQAQPAGVIEVEGDLDTNETKAMRDAWLEAHQGISHSFLPAILTGGAQWKQVTLSHVDAQFLEQMQFSASVISGMIYRVPPHMIGQTDKETSWGSGIEQQELGFVRNTLLIWLCRWEDLLTSWVPNNEFITFDLSHRLRGDALQRWSAYQIARVIGAMNNAEIRKAENLPTITDPAAAAVLEAYDAPLNSAPVKPTSTGGAGGDHAN